MKLRSELDVVWCTTALREGVLSFFRENSEQPTKADPAFFRWRYESHPLGSSLEMCQAVLDGPAVVGFLGALRDRVLVNGSWLDCVWILELRIAEGSRGGPALAELLTNVMERFPIVLATGVAPHMQRVYRSLKWVQRSVVKTHTRIIRLLPLTRVLRASNRLSIPLRALSPVLAAADAVSPYFQHIYESAFRPIRSELEVQAIVRFDQEWDHFFQVHEASLGITTLRNAAILNWKLCERPNGTNLLMAARDSGGDLVGYMASKLLCRPGIASWVEIVDTVVASSHPDAFDMLISEVVRFALRRRASCVRFRCSDDRLNRRLPAFLWLERCVPVIDDQFAYAADPAVRDIFAHSPWFLTSVVSDRADDQPSGDDNIRT